jgi:hypothetical protein
MTESFHDIAKEIVDAAHVHTCAEWAATEMCERHPCVCACGAVLDVDHKRAKPLDYAWRAPDGTLSPWPDPAEDGE